MTKSAVVISGATSSIGHFLVTRLLTAGYDVHALSRSMPPRSDSICWHRIETEGELPSLPVFETPGALIHLAPLWSAPDILPACAARNVDRVVAFGSTSVFTKKTSSSPNEQAIAVQLGQAERSLQSICDALGMRWILLRPTLVYAPGMDKNLSKILALVRRFRLFPLISPATGLRQPVHADDLALACVEILRRNCINNRAYNVSGGEILTYREMVERLFRAAGLKPRLLWIPYNLARRAIRLARRIAMFREVSVDMIDRMNVDLVFDHSSAREDFGFSPRKFNYESPPLDLPQRM